MEKRKDGELISALVRTVALAVAVLYLAAQFFFPSQTQDMPGFALVFVVVGLVASRLNEHFLRRELADRH